MSESQQRYRVVEKLESGGMAEVFRAESEGLQGFKKQVAIKRVLPHLSEKKRFISMFLDEARLSAQLSHSNCVQVFDIGVGDNAYFIVMEFVDGANLKAIAEAVKKSGKDFPVAAAAFIALEICKGLSYAHEMRDANGIELHIVHRDMSPPNVLVTKYGEIKIVDFGLAKANSQLEKSEPGIIKGKFSYLSPEAAMGQEVDARTDIFAVGIILWELLAGQRLFLGETDFQTVKKVQQAVVPSISNINKRVPPELERIMNKTLAREPAARYQTARDLGMELSKFLFAFGQPVSTYDIANIVIGAMKDKAKHRQPQGSIIDKLIEEALLEFTSLTDDAREAKAAGGSKKPPPLAAGAAPLRADQFVDPTNWAKEISLGDITGGADDSLRASLPPEVFEAGNLSALEDEPHSSPLPSQPRGGTPMPSQAMGHPGSTGAYAQQNMGSNPPMPNVPMPRQHGVPVTTAPKKGGGAGALVGVAVVLFAAAAVAAAWFTHLIPH
jgi:eukaryotic-like serine/threonine-protein kinase